MDNQYLKIYLPIYLTLYFLVAFVLPSVRTYRKTGINPITFSDTDNAHDYIGFVMKILIGLLFVVVLCFAFSDTYYSLISPILHLEIYYLKTIGLILIHLALFWITLAQFQMGTSWRIGIDQQHETDLVTKGVFSWSRNPIFLGMILSVFGIFLILPNALSLTLTVTTYFVIQIQIRLEEAFLQEQHGEHYKTYRQQVRRLL